MGLSMTLALTLGLLLLPSIGIDGRPTSPSSLSASLRQARVYCFNSGKLTLNQRLQIDKMHYEDKSYVHRYVHCFWSKLRLWQDNSGFSADGIMNRFGGPMQLNEEQFFPAIRKCNTDVRNVNRQERCYKVFSCVLSTPVGDWFRRRMSDVINGNF